MTMVRSRPSGFTLIELVVTMMIIGILAMAAVSRFSGTQDFDGRRYYDETLSALRYAQKVAIAQRRNVCVTFTGSPATNMTLSVAAASGSTVSCNPGAGLTSPTGVTPFVVAPRIPGISLNAAPANNFHFDALGRPRDALDAAVITQTFQVTNLSLNITIEQETGYVHP